MKKVYFIAGNIWLLVAVVVHLGKKGMRGAPDAYAFFGQGAWMSPGDYFLVEAFCVLAGAACLYLAHRSGAKE